MDRKAEVTKRQVIWFLIRLAGIWFLWQSIESAILLVGTFLHLIQEPEITFQVLGNVAANSLSTIGSFGIGLVLPCRW